MGKYAALFLFLGLAAGLWLGFNPTTHKQLTRWWERTNRATFSNPPALSGVRKLDTHVNRWLRTSPRPMPPTRPNAVPTGPQISGEMQAFWDALHRIWLNFVDRMRNVNS